MRRIGVRRLAVVATLAVAMLALAAGMPAHGQEALLFGYQMGSTASAISTIYNQPSFGIPADPTFELRKMYSLTELDSGPAAHALASVIWPGQTAGNAPANLLFDSIIFNPTRFEQLDDPLTQLKTQLAENTAGRGSYPIRKESFYPGTTTQDTSEDTGAGVRMDAITTDDSADAFSTSGGAGQAGLITFGSLQSRSTTGIEKAVAVAKSYTKITDLDLFGVIHVDGLTVNMKATSDGIKGAIESVLQIAGMVIKDDTGKPQLTVSLDRKGLHVTSPQGTQEQDPLKALTDAVKEHLEPQGLSLQLGQPLDTIDGATASSAVNALTLSLNSTGMNKLLGAMAEVAPDLVATLRNPTSPKSPLRSLFSEGGIFQPAVAGYVAAFFTGDQTVSFAFGSAAVQTSASPPFDLGGLTPPAVSPSLSDLPPLTDGVGGDFVPPAGSGGPGTVTTFGAKAVAVLGVPLTYLLLALAVAIAGATRLRLFADAVTTAAPATTCPLEER